MLGMDKEGESFVDKKARHFGAAKAGKVTPTTIRVKILPMRKAKG
ncbi:hypothetical protein P4479_14625 [Brevibacillus agri]|nr:hypothetical protein [Brevibacillus agri]